MADPGWEPAVDLGGGVQMPLVGCGTQFGFMDDGHRRGELERGADHVAMAVRTGFRLLDTARGYGTETHVLQGVRASGIDRRQVFVVTKACPGSDHAPGRESSRAAIAESATRLGGQVDLFLVHQTVSGWQDLWRSLEDAKDQGIVRAIGVSNFGPAHLEELATFARHAPAVNQLHLHPFVHRHHRAVIRHCAQHGIRIMAYPRSPWRSGVGTAVDTVAAACGRTRVQVMLRWAVDRGFAVIPLSTDPQHLRDNFAVREFRLTPEQVAAIDAIGEPTLHFHVDAVRAEGIAGWAFAPTGPVRIRVLVDGEPVGDATSGLPRVDVGAAYPDHQQARQSGFEFRFPAGRLARGRCEVSLSFELSTGEHLGTERWTVSGG